MIDMDKVRKAIDVIAKELTTQPHDETCEFCKFEKEFHTAKDVTTTFQAAGAVEALRIILNPQKELGNVLRAYFLHGIFVGITYGRDVTFESFMKEMTKDA